MQLARADWLVRLGASSSARNSKNRSFFQLFVTDEVGFDAIFFFFQLVLHVLKKYIHLGVGESRGYLHRRFIAQQISTTIHLQLSFPIGCFFFHDLYDILFLAIGPSCVVARQMRVVLRKVVMLCKRNWRKSLK